MTTRLKSGALVLMVLIGLLVISICIWDFGRNRAWWGESDVMRMVRSEPLSSQSLLNLTRTNGRSEQPSSLLKTSSPEVINCFIGGEAAFANVVDFAVADGWAERAGTRTASTWSGFKLAKPGGDLDAVITLDGNSVCQPGQLSVLTTYS